jgi:hypothetical protein
MMMLPERVEKLRLEYADQYVAVEGDLPRLARFKGKVGQVRTINVNGRALVEFEDDRGRYDLELDYLKVVDKPKPKEPPAAAKKPAPASPKPAQAKPEPKEKLSELELARQKKDRKPKQAAPPAEKIDEPKKP